MMLPLLDAQVRLVLLNHIAVRLSEDGLAQINSSGVETDQLMGLRELSPIDLMRLASMRELMIAVRLDPGGLKAGLRALRRVNEARALETYFIRNGASCQMMRTLFKIRHKVTLKHRRDCGAWRPSGHVRLPDRLTRQRIHRAWLALKDPNPRLRYFQLHHAFPNFSIAALEAVLRQFEPVA